jgi:hypothetical protein
MLPQEKHGQEARAKCQEIRGVVFQAREGSDMASLPVPQAEAN